MTKERQIFYLSGFFRCGNTLLRSIINQNPDFCVTPNSILPEAAYLLHQLKQNNIYTEYPDNEKYFNCIIKNIFKNYFSLYKQKYILEQGRWGTPTNFHILKEYGFLPAKFIILIRPFREIVSSWMRLYNLSHPHIEQYCEKLMKEHSPIGQAFLALNFLTKEYKENLLVIKYKDLCSNPEKIIKSIYNFLDIPYYRKHRFTNLDQIDGHSPQTIIRIDKIEQKVYTDKIKIPLQVREKYKNVYKLFEKYES
jgi:hypothetical protein